MISIKSLVLILGVVNVFAILVFFANSGTSQPQQEQEENFLARKVESHKFINKDTAYKVLELLDEFDEIPLENYNMARPPRKNFDKTYLGLKRDPEYCKKVRKYLVEHPEVTFEKINFITDYTKDSLSRQKVIPEIGFDVMTVVDPYLPMNIKDKPTYDLAPEANMFFFNMAFHNNVELGREHGCLSQQYSHVPGAGSLCRKDLVARSCNDYGEKFKDKPQCFDQTKFFPKTLALEHKGECQQFFEHINSEAYRQEKIEKTIVFIRKIGIGSHQGVGVQPVDENEEKSIREQYDNGRKCGLLTKSLLMQRYINNPLLVMGHKFDFRLYLIVASTNPVIAYYHDGFLRVSLYEYDVNKTEKGMHLTNTAQSINVIKNAAKDKVMGMNETELLNFQMWNLTRFTNYLLEEGLITNADWLDDYLRPAFQHAMQHIVRMTQHTYYPQTSSWELFGMDFMLDTDLNLWFIEANSGPVLKGSNKEKEILVKKMMKDMFEIIMGYMRSRIKRVIQYVNWMEEENLVVVAQDGEVIIPKLDNRRKEFKAIARNYFDKEFEPSSDNGWVKIVDENHDGKERYNGMFATECFEL